MDLMEGQVVIIDHRAFYESYHLAKIVRVTPSMVWVVNWNNRHGEWRDDDPQKRHKEAVKRIHGFFDEHDANVFSDFYNQLQAAKAEMDRLTKEARQSYADWVYKARLPNGD